MAKTIDLQQEQLARTLVERHCVIYEFVGNDEARLLYVAMIRVIAVLWAG